MLGCNPPHMTRERALMEMHVDALFTHDAAGRLLQVREPNGAPAPRFFLGRAADGSVVRRYRFDLDDALRRELDAAAAREASSPPATDAEERAASDLARYAEILGRFAPVRSMETGPAFCFPDALPAPYADRDEAVAIVTEANSALLERLLPAWIPDVRAGAPLFALVVDGAATSVCASVRITHRAHEAGVDTAPAFRGRGYAPRVVAAWALAIRARGIEPMYSTSWRNAASRAVARKLGLAQFGSDLHIT